jgi:hypothetical protein
MSSPFPVTAAEVAELAQESRRLTLHQDPAGSVQLRTYLRRKVDILERIAGHGFVLIDERTANGALAFARAQLDHCRQFAADGLSDA